MLTATLERNSLPLLLGLAEGVSGDRSELADIEAEVARLASHYDERTQALPDLDELGADPGISAGLTTSFAGFHVIYDDWY